MISWALLGVALAQSDATDAHAWTLGAFGAPEAPFWRGWAPAPQKLGEMSVTAAGEYARNSLGGVSAAHVPALMAVDYRVDYAPIAPLHLFAAGPFIVAADDRTGGEGLSGAAFGDLRLGGGARAPIADGSMVGLEAQVGLPTGPGGRELGAAGPTWDTRGVVHAGAGRLRGLLNVGVHGEPLSQSTVVQGGLYGTVLAGVAGRFTVDAGGFHELQPSVELSLREPFRATAVRESPAEITLGARAISGNNVVGLAFAKGLGHGQPSADWRVLIAYGRRLQTRDDIDLDGILDAQDDCRDAPETPNLFRDDDGCPDLLGEVHLVVTDTLGHTVPGAKAMFGDADVPTDDSGHAALLGVTPERRAVIAVRHPAYNDGVAVLDPVPQGPSHLKVLLVPQPVPFEIRLRGEDLQPLSGMVRLVGPVKVPPLGIGPDGNEVAHLIPGEWRAVISADGYGIEERTFHVGVQAGASDGPVDLDRGGVELVVTTAARTQVTPTQILISGAQIRFRAGGDRLDPDSLPVLEEIAERLVTHPEIRLVEIQGHTDNTGDDEANMTLSVDRVLAVRDFLIAYGVEPQRMRTIGFGESVPIDNNDTEDGRARNRRVQFVIIQRDVTP